MAGALHLAPAGADKTETVLALLRDFSAREKMPRVWTLFATRRMQLDFRARLAETADAPFFNLEFYDFGRLQARLLRMAGVAARQVDEAARYRLVRQLLRDMLAAQELRVFHGNADTRGLVTVLSRHFDELKQNLIDAPTYAAAASSPKERELALLYMRYQARLDQLRMLDSEGAGWLALDALRANPRIAASVDLLLVCGFDHFTLMQAQLLAALASAIPQTQITLTATDESGMPRRARLARQRLEAAFSDANLPLRFKTNVPESKRHPDLQRLRQRIFSRQSAGEISDRLRLISAPSPADEARAVLRDVKRRLLAGVRPDDILLLLRDWRLYASALTAAGQEFGLPLLLEVESRCSATPVIATLLDTLRLWPRFRRRHLLDALRSPYIDAGLAAAQIDQLERISLERQFDSGSAEDWLQLVDLARQAVSTSNDEPPPTQLTKTEAQELSQALGGFLDAVTPPPQASASDYAAWLDGLLGESGSNALRLRHIGRDRRKRAIPTRQPRPGPSWTAILRGMRAADDALSRGGGNPPLEWADLVGDLAHALDAPLRSPSNASRSGKALVYDRQPGAGSAACACLCTGLGRGTIPSRDWRRPALSGWRTSQSARARHPAGYARRKP